jgi:uncharacterized protein
MSEPATEKPPRPISNTADRQPRRKFLISGASGLIGTALVRSWSHNPIHILRLVRSRAAKSMPGGSETIFWDPEATPAIPSQDDLHDVVAVVHLSGANIAAARWTDKYKREIVSSRVNSTLALARALTRLEPRPQVWVSASAIGFYGDRGDEVLPEEAPAGAGFIAEMCVAWEAATRIAEVAGIRVVQARFGVALSREGGALTRLLPLFRLGLGGNLGNGRAWMPWVTLRDAVGIVNYCIDRDDIRGPVNVVAPNSVRNAEFTRALGSAIHRPAILPAPAFALRLAIGEMADEALLASARVAPAKLIQAGYQFADPEIAPALRGLIALP